MRMASGFTRQGLKVVIPGPLSDQQRLGYVFRSSKEHREDLQALMAELKRQSCLSGWPPAVAAVSVHPGLPINFERQKE